MSEQAMFEALYRVLPLRAYRHFVEWWFFKKCRWRCRIRLHHTYIFTEIDDWYCSRCRVDRHWIRIRILWMTPVLWRLTFRLKHGDWPAA